MDFAQISLFSNLVPTEIILDDNLSTSTANQILQTADHYIWFATYNGLIRYDGTRYDLFNGYANDEFKGNSIRCLYEDSKGRLWIGTNDSGIYYFVNDHFYQPKGSEELNQSMILGITEDRKQNIWLASPDGTYSINMKTSDLPSILLVNSIPIKDIAVDAGNRVWGVTSNGQLKFLKSNHWTTPDLMTDDMNQKLECVAFDGRSIWTGGYDDRLIQRKDSGAWHIYDAGPTDGLYGYSNISSGDDGRTWFAAENGIGIYDHGKRNFLDLTHMEMPIEHAIESVIQDHEGSIWIASSRSGVVKLSPGKFENVTPQNGLKSEVVNSIYKTETATFVGTDKGLTIFENGRPVDNELTRFLGDERIRHITVDREGNYWFATYGYLGAVKYGNGEISVYNQDTGLSYNKTRVILPDSSGRIWIGTKNGLNLIEDNVIVKIYDENSGLKNDYILSLCEGPNGQIYAGTDGGGIYIVRSGLTKQITTEDGLAGNVVFSMYYDGKGLWVLTSKGISRIEKNTIQSIDTLMTFGVTGVFQMIESEDGTIWFGTSSGVYSIPKDELLTLFDSENAKKEMDRFGVEDGLLDGITALSHSQLDSDGRISFCTPKGISTLDTIHELSNNEPPLLQIRRLIIDDKEVPVTEYVNLDADTRRIRFDFTALSYVNSSKVQFKYKLEGYDRDWSAPSNERTISYTNLRSGRYTFMLIGANNDGLWTEEPLTLTLYKEPKFFERAEVIIGIGLLLLLGIFTLYNRRIKRMKKSQEDLKELTIETITCLTSAIDAKDPYTEGHSQRVAKFSVEIAKEMGYPSAFCERLEYSALLHDVGKISTPDALLLKT